MEALKSFVNIMDTDISDLKDYAVQSVNEISQRAGVKGQFLNWVNLPQEQAKRVDELYRLAEGLKSQTGAKKLSVMGIGGSKHTVEHMLSINGFFRFTKIYI